MDDEVSQPTQPTENPQPAPAPPVKTTLPQPEKQRPEAPKGPGPFEKMKNKLVGYRRVLEVSHKPDKDELVSTARVVTVGIALMGAIGFIISVIYILLTQMASAGV